MKQLRLFLVWTLFLAHAPMALGQQTVENGDAGESDPLILAESEDGSNRAPSSLNRSTDLVATDVIEDQAEYTSNQFAEFFDIVDAKDQDQLLKACRKYFRAKELLDAQFSDKDSELYEKKAEILEREYSRELRQVLPES